MPDWLADADPRVLRPRGWRTVETLYVPVVVDGRPLAEVAREAGLPVSTARSRLAAIEAPLAVIRAGPPLVRHRPGRLKRCRYCDGPVPADAQATARVCSGACRVRRHRKRHGTWKWKSLLERERERKREAKRSAKYAFLWTKPLPPAGD